MLEYCWNKNDVVESEIIQRVTERGCCLYCKLHVHRYSHDDFVYSLPVFTGVHVESKMAYTGYNAKHVYLYTANVEI